MAEEPMPRQRVWLRRGLAFVLLAIVVLAIAHGPISRWWRAERLLAELSVRLEANPAARAEPSPSAVREEELLIPGHAQSIRARLYRNANAGPGLGVVLAHGVHHRGIEERRLVVFAQALARSGLVALTPELKDLSHYRVTQEGVSVISESVRYLATRDELLDRPRVGVVGFSFAGGLALVAAAQDVGKDMEYVVSVGGHHDLSRTLRFLISNRVRTPTGTRVLQAHEYGLVVTVLEYLDHFVPEADRATLESAFRAWLQEDHARARVLASQRTTAAGERLFQLLESHRLSFLRPELEALIDADRGRLAALSPRGRLRQIEVPVYLLHGAGDTVIPPSEARWASLELGPADHQMLVTPLVQHVAVRGAPSWREQLTLVGFMAQIL